MTALAALITCTRYDRQVLFRSELTAQMVHHLAQAFVAGRYRAQDQTHQLMRTTFGTVAFRRYCLDFTGRSHFCGVTFSNRANPDVVTYRGGVIAIADRHASDFKLKVSTLELHTGFSCPPDMEQSLHVEES